ncbi:MAG: hypothetical protein FWD57_15280, partial [Polyangiaceae bacterium]|nr:hypothetical protein [Polyangiaceae bacterium]
MPKLDEATILQLKSNYKQLLLVTDRDGDEYVCRLPTQAEIERHSTTAINGSKMEAMYGLVTNCVVWPDKPTLTKMLEEYAMLVVTLEHKICEFAKLDQSATA